MYYYHFQFIYNMYTHWARGLAHTPIVFLVLGTVDKDADQSTVKSIELYNISLIPLKLSVGMTDCCAIYYIYENYPDMLIVYICR